MSDTPLFTLVHVTDTHYKKDRSELRSFVELINSEKSFALPDFIIHTGDIIRGYNETITQHHEQMREAKSILDELKPPAYYACHNHDTYGETIRGRIFDEIFGSPHVQEIERDGFYFLILSGALTSSDIYGKKPWSGEGGRWGLNYVTPKGLVLVRSRLESHAHCHKLVFVHSGLVDPRKEPIFDDPNAPRPSRSGFGYRTGEALAKPAREEITRAKVVAHYSGHCHINSRHKVAGVEYISTASLLDFPGEFKHISVFADRIENKTVQVPGGNELRYRWGPMRDKDHADAESYYAGNEAERNFTIPLPA